MSIRVAIQHRTSYTYDRLVQHYPHIFRLRPAPHCRTPIFSYSFQVEGGEHYLNWQQDPFGNYQARLVFPEKMRRMEISVEVIADMVTINPFDFFLEEAAEEFPFPYSSALKKELSPYLRRNPRVGQLFKDFLARVDLTPRRTVDFLVDVNQLVYQAVDYGIRMEPGVQTPHETLKRGQGSCRDSAWLMVELLRHLGLAARFVSGYLIQLKPDQESLDGPSGPPSDFTDLHAWVEAYVPGGGWIGLDPTSGLFAGEGHIPLAAAPHFRSAAPIEGRTSECETTFDFSNEVYRIREAPRVTQPYQPAQWEKIDALGKLADRRLADLGVKMTTGGEPTFVALDHPDEAEWNTAADGPQKRRLANVLLRKMKDHFGPGGLLLHTQGKWYPGEDLPRWAEQCYWRKDGQPLWHHPELLADTAIDYGHGIEDAERFARRFTEVLGVQPHVVPGYEDLFFYLWKEGTLPYNTDPHHWKLDEDFERANLVRTLDQGLKTATGYAIPLQWDHRVDKWTSSDWVFRRPHMFLMPGSSPMGLRLPLRSLPWIPEDKRPLPFDRSPLEALEELQNPLEKFANRYQEFLPDVQAWMESIGMGRSGPQQALQSLFPTDDPVHLEEGELQAFTAMTVQPRQGKVHLFLPPANHLEHYLELVAAAEITAKELDLPLVLEGYEPPHDHRLQNFKITPDPGVIEVNTHPAKSWEEQKFITETLYREARASRLGTDKFLHDGRHTGTGGGNHVTIGGEIPAESPFLRRPELLQSFLTYWQHHPALSYLFSGLFIGPTSQAPRVDEARTDRLYDLEVAFQGIPKGEVQQPWIVDRALRNFLTDLTGNTHRAEFCIDKLFSPDSSTGRLGIVEFRGFEMPPHPQMSLVQNVLLRTLLAKFWEQPYDKRLVRWGTELHDKFMLPHFCRQDMKDVAEDLTASGFPMELDWFEPFVEFRFPLVGTVDYDGIELEVRNAIEPWTVLGEESAAGGTARYVDSSIERIQVKVTGLTDRRHVLACNGRQIPLRSTGTHGEYVAGIRYKAWNPHSSLHPFTPLDSPLQIDLFDTWSDRSLGGCTYHVAHPGGRNPETAPVNAYEAEGRRLSRFQSHGHQQGLRPRDLQPLDEEAIEEFPVTLDMRRAAETRRLATSR
ncbi:MAG: transglutaminase family protein [Verrucomicrobiota bacterium]